MRNSNTCFYILVGPRANLQKGKFRPRTRQQGQQGPQAEQRYSSTLSLNSAQDSGRVLNATLRPLYHRERNPVPIVQEAGWVPEQV